MPRQRQRHRARGDRPRLAAGLGLACRVSPGSNWEMLRAFLSQHIAVVLSYLDMSFDNGESDCAEQSIRALARV
jgi:hypothetical protein